jgi:hypothetical protein
VKLFYVCVISTCLSFATSLAQAQLPITWSGIENTQPVQWHMTWNGAMYEGFVDLPNLHLRARAVAVWIPGRVFLAHRDATQDGNICNFFADAGHDSISTNSATGTFTCGNGAFKFQLNF